MKILFYDNRIQKDQIVGAGVHISEVNNGLTKLGHTIRYADGKYHSLIMPSQTKVFSQTSRSRSFWEKVKNFIWRLPFHGEALLAFYIIKDTVLFFKAFRVSLCFKPDLIYSRRNMYNGGYLLSKILRIPCVKEVNGLAGEEHEIGKKGDKFSLWLVNIIEKFNFKCGDKYIAVTSKLKETLSKDYNVPFSKIVVILNGANTDLFRPMDIETVKKEINLDDKSSFICFVGSLAVYHGVKYLILAMPLILKEYPPAKALIVGESKLQTYRINDELLSLSNRLGVMDKVIFTGSVPYEKVPLYINASEICVMSAPETRRNLRTGSSALKICEYLACGKPVITSRMSGLEFLEENHCGILVPPESPEELAKAIITLLRDRLSRQRMGEIGRKYVVENRSWESVVKKVAEVFDNALKNHNIYNG